MLQYTVLASLPEPPECHTCGRIQNTNPNQYILMMYAIFNTPSMPYLQILNMLVDAKVSLLCILEVSKK